jgi:hypothetical protein
MVQAPAYSSCQETHYSKFLLVDSKIVAADVNTIRAHGLRGLLYVTAKFLSMTLILIISFYVSDLLLVWFGLMSR